MDKPLFIPLKAEYFNAFLSGKKSVEYRPYGPGWNDRTCTVGRHVTLSLGYGKHSRISGVITRFERTTAVQKLPGWAECYGNKHREAACIHIALADTERNGMSGAFVID